MARVVLVRSAADPLERARLTVPFGGKIACMANHLPEGWLAWGKPFMQARPFFRFLAIALANMMVKNPAVDDTRRCWGEVRRRRREWTGYRARDFRRPA